MIAASQRPRSCIRFPQHTDRHRLHRLPNSAQLPRTAQGHSQDIHLPMGRLPRSDAWLRPTRTIRWPLRQNSSSPTLTLPFQSSLLTGLSQRFAYYTTIPVFILQILLLCLGIYATFSRSQYQSRHEDIEKSGHQLRNVSSSRGESRGGVSFDTKNGSPVSYQDSTRILHNGRQ